MLVLPMKAELPDLKLLHVFAAVVRCQGFANAQQELQLSVASISNYMSQLESELGIPLCHRGRSGFRLTSRGEQFYQQTLQLFTQLERFGRYTQSLKGELRGTFRLGTLDAMASHPALPLASAIGLFGRQHPAVHLSLSILPPWELQLAVADDRLDLAIGAFPAQMNGLLYQPLYLEQHYLYCGQSHPLFGQQTVSSAQIAKQRMVSRSYWNEAELARHGFRHSEASVETMEAQLILLLSGAWIGYLPEHYARPWVAQGRLHVLNPAIFAYQSPFSLIVRKKRVREPLIQAFKSALKTVDLPSPQTPLP